MMKRTNKSTKSTTREDVGVDHEIVKEARRWMLDNKGTSICDSEYTSPRISSEIPDCSMPMTFDHLNYCSLGCLYCFAYFFKSNNPTIKEVTLKSVDTKRMAETMRGNPRLKQDKLMYDHFYSKRFLLHWGGLADPFDDFEKHNKTGLYLMRELAAMDYPTLFSFKGRTIFDRPYMRLFERYAHQQNFAFQTSIVTNSDKLAKQLEVGVPSTTRRLEAIKILSDMGYYTILRLRPFTIGVSDVGLEDLLERALEAGIQGVSMEFFAMDGRANTHMKERYKWLAKLAGVPDLMKYYKDTSPSERGGYRRGNRHIKEPYVRTVYEFCVKHGLTCGISDPDFKELNTSGSCCGMPDKFPDNKGLENWTRSQLTYHIKEARIKYHKTGENQYLTFDGVYGNESYLDTPKFANDHVSVIGRPLAERNMLTQRIILQEQWNNLRSAANPRNYFHGKLMPTCLDEKGNYVFKYQPMEYEERWKNDGIDLTV